MSDILKDGSYYKLYTQTKSTSACGLPKGFFSFEWFRAQVLFHSFVSFTNTSSFENNPVIFFRYSLKKYF